MNEASENQCSAVIAAAILSNSAKSGGNSVNAPASMFSRKWVSDVCRGQQDVQRPVQQPRERNLHRRRYEPVRVAITTLENVGVFRSCPTAGFP